MVTISKDKISQRWDTLGEPLREALVSEVNSDFIWKACEGEHIPEKIIYDVSRIAGYVLMGFLHPEDMAGEMKEELGLDQKVCDSIAKNINVRVFAPLKQDLEKAYAPSSKLDQVMTPRVIQDVTPGPAIIALSTTKPATPAPKVTSQTFTAAPKLVMPPPPAPASASTPAKPATPSVGWSRSTEQPVVKLSQSSIPPPQNTAAQRVTQPAPRPAASIPINGPVGEFERRAIQTGEKKITPPGAPGPVIIHEDTSFKPAQQPPNFHLQLQNQEMDAMRTTPQQPPMRAAFLELGKPQTPPTPPGSMSTPRVVHYSEYKSPSPEAPVTPSSPRQVTELTGSPSIPKPPTPPQNTQSSQNKVIYKDYTAPPPPSKP